MKFSQNEMPAINFYLKNPKSKTDTFILLKFNYHKRRFNFSTRQKIHPSKWNFNKHRAKQIANSSDHIELNKLIEKIKNETLNRYHQSLVRGELPTRKELSDHLLEVMLLKYKDEDIENLKEYTFYDYLDIFISESEQYPQHHFVLE